MDKSLKHRCVSLDASMQVLSIISSKFYTTFNLDEITALCEQKHHNIIYLLTTQQIGFWFWTARLRDVKFQKFNSNNILETDMSVTVF